MYSEGLRYNRLVTEVYSIIKRFLLIVYLTNKKIKIKYIISNDIRIHNMFKSVIRYSIPENNKEQGRSL